jgi:hypothetical protein
MWDGFVMQERENENRVRRRNIATAFANRDPVTHDANAAFVGLIVVFAERAHRVVGAVATAIHANRIIGRTQAVCAHSISNRTTADRAATRVLEVVGVVEGTCDGAVAPTVHAGCAHAGRVLVKSDAAPRRDGLERASETLASAWSDHDAILSVAGNPGGGGGKPAQAVGSHGHVFHGDCHLRPRTYAGS